MQFPFFRRLSHDLGIDLGTANTLVYMRGRGIVINEPSVVAQHAKTGQVLAVGDEAKRMLGKAPGTIQVIRPLVDGIISDFEVTERMLKYFLTKVQKGFSLTPKPRVVIAIPLEVTEVERKAVEDAVLSAGAREVFLVEEPMAAAIGARLPIGDPQGSMIVDIGGGTTDIAVIALGGMVQSRSLKVAGDEMDHEIREYARVKYNLLIGERTAEEVKMKIGSAFVQAEPQSHLIRGRDLLTGLPRQVEIHDDEIRDALKYPLSIILENIMTVIELTPPELVADVYEKGIIVTGGGALLRGIDQRIAQETGVPVRVTDDPLTSVALGTGVIIEDLDHLKDLLIQPTQLT